MEQKLNIEDLQESLQTSFVCKEHDSSEKYRSKLYAMFSMNFVVASLLTLALLSLQKGALPFSKQPSRNFMKKALKVEYSPPITTSFQNRMR